MKKLLFSCLLLWLLPTLTWATTVNAWLNPANITVITAQDFTLDIVVNSTSVKVGQYSFVVTFDTTKLRLDITYMDAAGLCVSGICPGINALSSRVSPIVDGNTITLLGSDFYGVGPGNDLQLLVIHFTSRYVADAPSFTTSVSLRTNFLTTIDGDNIGTGAAGATVNVTTTVGLCGDVDGNGTVNVVDALAISRKVVGLPPPPTVDVSLADVDLNGVVNIVDALLLLEYYVGLIPSHEVCAIGQPL